MPHSASYYSRLGDTLPPLSNAACANAVSTHCIASVHAAATPLCASEHTQLARGRPNNRSATLGLIVSALALGAGLQPAVSVRDSNPRLPDYWSGALPLS